VPPILAHLHPPTDPRLLLRVDTRAALLAASLYIARLPDAARSAPAGSRASPLAFESKALPASSAGGGVAPRARVEERTCLVASTASAGENSNVKESVVGARCEVGAGARVVRCVLMDEAVVGENVSVTGCILGPGCKILGGPRASKNKTDLRECDVAAGFKVPWGSELSPTSSMRFVLMFCQRMRRARSSAPPASRIWKTRVTRARRATRWSSLPEHHVYDS
jgi:translation initiation factor eIF-2B subunit gamma